MQFLERIARALTPRLLWYISIPCNVAAGVVILLLLIDPWKNLELALWILLPAATVLYGTAFIVWWRRRDDRGDREGKKKEAAG